MFIYIVTPIIIYWVYSSLTNSQLEKNKEADKEETENETEKETEEEDIYRKAAYLIVTNKKVEEDFRKNVLDKLIS